MKLQSRMTVFFAIGGLLAMMGGIVFYASLDNESLESVEILSGSARVVDIDTVAERAKIVVTFDVRNPSKTTFTIPGISYDLSVGGKKIVSGEYSTADVAMPGRVVFTTGEIIPLKSTTYIARTESNSALYDDLLRNEFAAYDVVGTVTVESAWSIIEKDFDLVIDHEPHAIPRG